MSARVRDAMLSLALYHNLTPITNDDSSGTYQASSPDEVTIVKWTESVGVTHLTFVDRTRMELRTPSGSTLAYVVLEIFPLTSESERMGIVVAMPPLGADVVMARIVQRNDWLEEETANMAREGLRTLVVARRKLSEAAYRDFRARHHTPGVRVECRNEAVATVVADTLERDLELLGLTGVEDKLQDDVRGTLELLRNAGIKIWMLTGDKIKTATVIAISTKLVARNQYIHQVAKREDFPPRLLRDLCLNLFKNLDEALCCRRVPMLAYAESRRRPTYPELREEARCCIGDGRNDVGMIQSSKQPAMSALGLSVQKASRLRSPPTFSVTQFSYLTKLLLWHGRNSYRRSAKLAQFVIHRGLIISVMQAVFSSIFYFAPIALYQGWLMVGYATIYTMAPAFSLVLDRDLNEGLALSYPELYKELAKASTKVLPLVIAEKEWGLVCLAFPGATIMIIALVLFENELLNIVAISFTALNELIMVALEITIWHVYMMILEVVTLGIYAFTMIFLPEYFDLSFFVSTRFGWKVAVIVASRIAPEAGKKTKL
ncbi:hypothetical protein BC826DRAFT_974171 [Russula brevipes]|nr:hypothetical protein BC826DRAFT_974171 [Russula brevipes]